jgi:hypothetical protein
MLDETSAVRQISRNGQVKLQSEDDILGYEKSQNHSIKIANFGLKKYVVLLQSYFAKILKQIGVIYKNMARE